LVSGFVAETEAGSRGACESAGGREEANLDGQRREKKKAWTGSRSIGTREKQPVLGALPFNRSFQEVPLAGSSGIHFN
jgi:hypothetical protein